MSDAQSHGKFYLRSLSRIGLFVVMAGGLFAIFAILIFMIRSQRTGSYVLPELTSVYYIDVHNELQRQRLRVEIEKRNYLDRPPGIILEQSIDPGTVLRPDDKLVLVVNQHPPLIEVPELVNNELDTAMVALGRIALGEDVYTLQPGAVSYIENDSLPANTVIAQFPPAGTRVVPDHPVDFLVTSKGYRSRTTPATELKGMTIDLAVQYFLKTEQPFRISEVTYAASRDDNGKIEKVEKKDDIHHLTVMYRDAEESFKTGFERVDVKTEKQDECTAVHFPLNMAGREQVIFQGPLPSGDSTFIFFRTGSEQFELRCGEKTVHSKKFQPEYPG